MGRKRLSEIISAKWRRKGGEEASQTGLIRRVVQLFVSTGCRVHDTL